MNTKLYIGALALAMTGAMTSCGEFEPTGYEEIPDLPTAQNLRADISGHTIDVTWQLPAAEGITDVLFIRDADNEHPQHLGATATSCQIVGQPMGVEGLYTVKICYDDKYVSPGVTASATLPVEVYEGVSNLKSSVAGRKVTLTWDLPQGATYTGIRIVTNGAVDQAVELPVGTTSHVMKTQPMEIDLNYDVQLMYDTYYPSKSAVTTVRIPYIEPKMGFVMTAATIDQLPDDDERAAANWFIQQPNTKLVQASEIANIDSDECPVLWVCIDRVDLPMGWENLPFTANEIAALKRFSADGGALFLSSMATQLTVPLGIVPDNMAPTVYGNGEGGSGNDYWTINPFLGVDFKNGSDQGYYDRSTHAIFKGLTLEDPNGWGLPAIPLIGPGNREDHNCLWDCNIYGRGDYRDVIANFEAITGSLVLATWGHVRDHCIAGLVDFFKNAEHGQCVAMGLAAYEWNQNSGPNVYQHNIEQLTANILDYLKQ